MKIAFFDPSPINYSTDTVNKHPLGGSQSSVCYLANNLAQLGHSIFLINNVNKPIVTNGVACLPISCVSHQFWLNVDFIIRFNGANYGETLRKICGKNTNIILWNQHAHDQPAIQKLSEKQERESYDYFFFISNWQAEKFVEIFGIKKEKIIIFRNAIGNSFEGGFSAKSSVLAKKVNSLVLAYTSTPFRGLDLLVNIFPQIQERFPDVKLKIFSSMKVYQFSDEQDNKNFGDLYVKLNAMNGVEYIGSLPQPELAQALKSVSILAYPNTFAETSCIAVMEAMASGCHIITSDLGALPETTAGFATLVPFNPDLEIYKQDFVTATIQYIEGLQSTDIDKIEARLSRQVEYCQQNYVWEKRAHEWLVKLYEIRGYQFFCLEDYHSAIILYEEAIATYPDNVIYYCYLVLSLAIVGEQESAISTLLLYVSHNKTSELSDLHDNLEGIVELEIQRLTENNNQDTLEAIHEFISLLE